MLSPESSVSTVSIDATGSDLNADTFKIEITSPEKEKYFHAVK